jgi:hypothetical protein
VSVSEAIERDLEELRSRDPQLADSALAASARVLAQELDKDRNSATSKSMCARALQDTLEQLRELAPPAEVKDKLDELESRRTARRGRTAA